MKGEQLNFPGIDPARMTPAEVKQFVRDRLEGLKWRQKIRDLKRLKTRRRNERRRKEKLNALYLASITADSSDRTRPDDAPALPG